MTTEVLVRNRVNTRSHWPYLHWFTINLQWNKHTTHWGSSSNWACVYTMHVQHFKAFLLCSLGSQQQKKWSLPWPDVEQLPIGGSRWMVSYFLLKSDIPHSKATMASFTPTLSVSCISGSLKVYLSFTSSLWFWTMCGFGQWFWEMMWQWHDSTCWVFFHTVWDTNWQLVVFVESIRV